MAFKTSEKQEPDNEKVAVCSKQETKKKWKSIRKKYFSKRNELQVRRKITTEKSSKSENHINILYSSTLQGLPPAPIMLYPSCPQYYPITLNEWSPVIPVQCPLYSLQPIPIIVNPPLLPTQICPYSPIVPIPSVTVANEFPVAPLVSANEFSLHMSNEVSPTMMPNKLSPVHCEMSHIIASNGFSVAVSNEVALLESHKTSHFSPFAPQVSYEVTPVIPLTNECSSTVLYDHQFSSILTPMSDIFSPNQSIQVPNEFIPFCATVSNEISFTCSYESFSCQCYECELPVFEESVHEAEVQKYDYLEKPLEFYLSLPKDLFPTARMMTIDPNSMIDEFCKVPNVDDHSWILDLEFGVPKTPVNRRVATYNVKFNSIHCKNVPEAIHPGFENCDKDLKRALIFYYDCVISNWYTGYMAISSDSSVKNFQSWLLLPMQVLGMCWP